MAFSEDIYKTYHQDLLNFVRRRVHDDLSLALNARAHEGVESHPGKRHIALDGDDSRREATEPARNRLPAEIASKERERLKARVVAALEEVADVPLLPAVLCVRFIEAEAQAERGGRGRRDRH